MTAQPNQRNFGTAPATSSGTSRLAAWTRTLMTSGALIVFGGYAAQLFLPEYYRPGVVAGRTAGETVKAETEAMQNVRVEYERRLADAQAQAATKAQADLVAIQAAAQTRTESLQVDSTMAGLADMLCLGGQVVAAMTAPNGRINGDWRRPDPNTDIYQGAKSVAATACNAGGEIRQEMTRSQMEAIRTASAARGVSMNDGSVRYANAPDQVAPDPALPVQVPHYHWSDDKRQQLSNYAAPLPIEVKRYFVEGIDTAHYGLTDEYYDRVYTYWLKHLDALSSATVLQAAIKKAGSDADMPPPFISDIRAAPTPTAPVQAAAKPVVKIVAAKAGPSKLSAAKQGQLRLYSYRMPNDVLRGISADLDISHGYPDAWYTRVASYQEMHKG